MTTPRVLVEVARSEEPFGSLTGTIDVDPQALEARHLEDGAFIELMTDRGRRVIGRARAITGHDRSDHHDHGSPIHIQGSQVYLDRLMRQTLRCHIGDELVLSPAQPESARRVVIQTPFDISRSHGLRDSLRCALANARMPCVREMRFYAAPDGGAGIVYEVGEVDPREGIITSETAIEFLAVEQVAARMDVGFEDVGGLSAELRQIRELIEIPLRAPWIYRSLGIAAPRGVILCGPPGAGKTHIARAVANDIDAHVITINGPSVVGSVHGETESNLRTIFAEAAHHAPTLILIDELDGLAPHRRDAGSQSDVRAVTTLLACMDGLESVDGVVVIGTTNRINEIDPALRRPGRFDREIIVGPPDTRARLEILEIHARDMPLTTEARTELPRIAELTAGFVGADIVELCREAGLSALRRAVPAVSRGAAPLRLGRDFKIRVDADDFHNAVGRVRPSAGREAYVEYPEFNWDELVGLERAKTRLRYLITQPVERLRKSENFGTAPIFGSGILLTGPAGSGKSALVRGLASEARVGLCVINGPELFGRWLGESEAALRESFTIARRLAPTILFIDQLDSIAPERGRDTGSMTTTRVVNQLLAELDTCREFGRVALIAATDRPDLIDPAVVQPDRFGTHINVELPDRDARSMLLKRFLQSEELIHDGDIDHVVAAVADLTNGRSASYLRRLVETTALELLAEQEEPAPAPSTTAILELFERVIGDNSDRTTPEVLQFRNSDSI